MKTTAEVLVVTLALVWCAVCVAMVVLGAGCHVYEEPEPACEHDGGAE